MAALGQEEAFDGRVQMVDNPHQAMNAALGNRGRSNTLSG